MASARPRRERKSVDHFTPGGGPPEPKPTAIAKGKGAKLADIPNVNFKLDQVRGTDEVMETLHQVLFKTKGKGTTRKRQVKEFSGFVYPEGQEEAERAKAEVRLSRLTVQQLHAVMDTFEVPRGSGEDGTKEKKVERLLAFLEEPKALGTKDLAEQAAKKKAKTASKRGGAAARPARARKPRRAKKVEEGEDDEEEDEEEEEEDEEEEEEAAAEEQAEAAEEEAAADEEAAAEEEAEEEADEAPKPKRGARKATPAKRATPARKTAAKKPAAAKRATPARKRKAADGEEAPPPTKRAKAEAAFEWPADETVRADVTALLEAAAGASEEITVNLLCKRLGEKYGLAQKDVKAKKALIKDTVADFLARGTDAEGGPAAMETDETAGEGEPAQAEAEPAAAEEPAKPAEAEEAPAAAEPEPAVATEADAAAGEEAQSEAPLITEPATTEGDENKAATAAAAAAAAAPAPEAPAPPAEQPAPPAEAEAPAAPEPVPVAPQPAPAAPAPEAAPAEQEALPGLADSFLAPPPGSGSTEPNFFAS